VSWSFGGRGRSLARGINVYRQGGGESLYDNPMGSESAVREFWSEPAADLGLPLLADVYEHGFHRGNTWSGSALRQVVDELARLEEYWASAGLPGNVLADLRERAGYLWAAVAIAERCGGFVDIA
jgi:hypothetical protein